jgi:hypothetical protein
LRVLHLRAVAFVGLALGLAALVACGGGGGSGSGGPQGDAFSISTSVVNFSATQGGAAPAQQIVNVVVNSGTVFVATTQSGGNFGHSFSITGQTTGRITITPATPVTPGNSTGTITVRGCSNETCTAADVAGSPKTITVNYAVAAAPTLTSTPHTVSFFTATGALPPSRSVDLALSTGSTTWTSSIVYTFGPPGWLSVTPTSGLLPQAAVLRVVSLPPGAGTFTVSANVTFTAGLVTRTVPVTLTVNDPGVYSVAPYIATVGVGGEVFLRGYGFSVLDPATLQVQFAGLRALTATIVSDTEIRATYAPMTPAVTPGNVGISVSDATHVIPQRFGARFLVVTAPRFLPATSARPANPGAVGNLIYDAERQAIYLMDADNNRIERYRFDNNWAPEIFFYGASLGNPRLALVPGGDRLVKTHGNSILLLNALDLGSLGFFDSSGLLGAGAILNQIAVANDGGAVGGAFAPNSGISLYRFDVLSQRFSELSTQSDMANRTIVASENGDTLVLPTFESLVASFAKPVFIYNATTGALSQKGVSTTATERASVSRTGARMILATDSSSNPTTRVYDYDGTTLSVRGDLPTGANGFVISPDGNTAYAYYSANSTLRKFDLTAPGFPLRASPSVDAPGGQFAQLTISPDGGTIVMAGTQNVVVVPAP